MCAIATSVSAQISALPADFKSNVSKPAQTETEIPAYTGVADADPMWLTSEELCRRFVGETFYRIGECSELKIVDNQLRLLPLSDSKYVFRGTIVVPDKIRNGYFGTDSLLLAAMNSADAEKIRHILSNHIDVDFLSLDKKRAVLNARLKVLEKEQAELKQMVKLRDSLKLRVKKAKRRYTYKEWQADGFIGLPNTRNIQQMPVSKFEWVMRASSFRQGAISSLEWALKRAEIAIESRMVHVDERELRVELARQAAQEKVVEQYRESYDFLIRYYAEYNAKKGSYIQLKEQKKHPYGNHFIALQDSLGGIHYIQASLIKDQFVAAKYYDRIRNALVGKNVCFLRNLPEESSNKITDAYSGEHIPIEYSYLDANISQSRKQLYLCKNIVVHGKQPTLCAIIEKGEIRFLASIERHLLSIDEENFRYKHGVKLRDKHFLLPESAFDAEEERLIRDEQAKIQANEDARKAAIAEEKAAEAKRKAELVRRFGAEAGAKIAQGRVALGMSKEMCREAWGSPTYRQQAKTLTGTSEIWYYTFLYDDRRLVFANDKLVEIFE